MRNLKGLSKQELQVCGQFSYMFNARLDKEAMKQEICIVKGLVGLPAIEALNFLLKIHTISTDKETIVLSFSKLLSGLGCLTEEYDVQLN